MLHSTVLQERHHNLPQNSNQMVHSLHKHHWIVAANILQYLQVAMFAYDSLHATIDKESIALVMAMFGTEDDSFVCIPVVKTQNMDCGLFAIAYMTTLAYGEDPTEKRYRQSQIKAHLVCCIANGKLVLLSISN